MLTLLDDERVALDATITARYWKLMSPAGILTEECAQTAASAGLRARRTALAAGHPVVFVDDFGWYVEELPDGTRPEIRLQPGTAREAHLQILGEISTPDRQAHTEPAHSAVDPPVQCAAGGSSRLYLPG